MSTCKACGAQNRDEAKFCKSCGSPLPQKKAPVMDKAKEAAVRKFWLNIFLIGAVVCLAGAAVFSRLSAAGKMETIKLYSEKYAQADIQAFSGLAQASFVMEGLGWNMPAEQIQKVYKYSKPAADPDFTSSLTVQQGDFKQPVPHADFMSLGIYNGRLYAIKYEFGPQEQYQAQQLKYPNRDEIMYGRFRGLYNVFTGLFGPPSHESYEAKKYQALEAIRIIRNAKTDTGAPTNVYIYWEMGKTRLELVLFGGADKLHLTVRMLYIPVWDAIGK